jgi:exodeoxyribonuclease VII large subunit
VPVRSELIAYVEDQGARARGVVRRQLGNSRDRLRAAAGELPRPLDLLNIARQRLDHASSNLSASLRHLGQQKRLRFATAAAKLSPNALRTDLRHARAQLLPLSERLQPAYRRVLTRNTDRLISLSKLLESLSYKGILARGFALLQDDAGHIVRSKDAVRPGQLLVAEVSDGSFGVNVSGAPAQRKKTRPPRDDGGQESLF